MMKGHEILQTEKVSLSVATARVVEHWVGDQNVTSFSPIQKGVYCCALGKGFYTNFFCLIAMLMLATRCVSSLCSR